ncbi:DegV family protein [Paenibacillus sp. CC-CFT747]|nr:DegV family protein [Paenibacillus sp. CC-CFT747]
MSIQIITDGSSDLPAGWREQAGVRVVPLKVLFDEEESTSDMDTGEFYERMKQGKSLPKTSSPSPHDFLLAYRESADRDLLVICLSSGLSSTYHHALMAKEMLLEEGYAGSIEVLDARTTSLGLGVLVMQAARLAALGGGIEETAAFLRSRIPQMSTLFTLDTLENVIKGGRLDRFRGTVATVLNIKLLMQASPEGTLELVEKCRGRQNAVRRLIDLVGEKETELGDRELGIAHSNCLNRALEVKEEIEKRYSFREIVVSDMGPVIGTYAGEGGLLLAF